MKKTITITIPSTGTTDGTTAKGYGISPGGRLVKAQMSYTDALATHASNRVAFSLKNLGQAGAGTTDMLSTAAANSTHATGGSAVAAHTKRDLTLHGTIANRDTAEGDRLEFTVTSAGTPTALGDGRLLLTFQRRS